MKFKLYNNIIGWAAFIVALVVYTLTLEPSVSLWDCGEFISASYKLQVVHPPGAPFFLLIGRIFTLFASDPSQVAFMVNMLSAVATAFTVLFTFWITTHFAKKIVSVESSTGNLVAVLGSGVVAALAVTFSESVWFSAVEAEVYALSSFFTAITFWVALKWEESNSKFANKWLVLIAYLIGLAIGTHLLNLLVIPAVVLIYYFKYYKYSHKGLAKSLGVGLVILFFIQKGIIPGVPKLMAEMDLFFVNSLGFGFNTGTIFAILLLIGLAVFGIYYFTVKSKSQYVSLGFICFAYILLGYSSYAMVVIRSSDDPAIDMNNPEEPFQLLSYINREQYGDRPLLNGPYFNAKPIDVKTSGMKYRKDDKEYVELGPNQEYIFDPEYNTYFPRMGDMQKDGSEQGYRSWGGMSEVTNAIEAAQSRMQQEQDPKKQQEIQAEIEGYKAEKLRFSNNLKFLWNYQLGHMYMRYFMWNFAGRQNDLQGHDYNKYIEGNWISGIKPIDNFRLGPQDNMPDNLAKNQARNKYYFLPLILGILGLILHFKKGKNDAIIVMSLFLFTGILINIFLNQPPYEPRERDYSLAGSFQTFCIWIGLGVLFLYDKLKNKTNAMTAGLLATVIALSAPVIMGAQGWDDHDRSDRYLGLDFAKNYLMSCPKNAVLFTNGDNDTYPLWYAQNVEGIRTDIRIINQSLLPTDWYSQVLLKKVYESEPLPLTLTFDQLKAGKNDYFQGAERMGSAPINLRQFINGLVNSPTPSYNTTNFVVPVNKQAVLDAGVVSPEEASQIVDNITINFPQRGLNKGDLVLLDLIATNAERGWKRPICFTTTSGSEGFLNMEPYFERRGLVFELIPIRSQASRNRVSRINEKVLYNNLVKDYKYSGISTKEHFFLDDKAAIVPNTIQNLFISTAGDFLNKMKEIEFNDSLMSNPENKAKYDDYKLKVKTLVDRCVEVFPNDVLFTKSDIRYSIAQIYNEIGEKDKAEKELAELFASCQKELTYYLQFQDKRQKSMYMMGLAKDAFDTMERCMAMAKEIKNTKMASDMERTSKELSAPTNNFLNTL